MIARSGLLVLAMLAAPAHAAVLCTKLSRSGTPHGAVRVRDACRPDEVQLSPADVGFCCTPSTTTTTTTTTTVTTTTSTPPTCNGWGGACDTGLIPGWPSGPPCCAPLTCARVSSDSDMGLCTGQTCTTPADCPSGNCGMGYCCVTNGKPCVLGCCPGYECGTSILGIPSCCKSHGTACDNDFQCCSMTCDASTGTCQ